jgi:hypothetical protein
MKAFRIHLIAAVGGLSVAPERFVEDGLGQGNVYVSGHGKLLCLCWQTAVRMCVTGTV